MTDEFCAEEGTAVELTKALEHYRKLERESRPPTTAEVVRVLEGLLAKVVTERDELRRQVVALQAANTREVEARRALLAEIVDGLGFGSPASKFVSMVPLPRSL